ncbi:MAG: diguanylate cyclase, partial [Candidatus Sedimenticola endophacoides]
PLQFRYRSSVDRWLAAFDGLGKGSGTAIEITEGLLMERDPVVLEQLLRLRDAGVEIALDDFGTGYSSLAYLKDLDIDYIKIDRSFVSHLRRDSQEAVLCEAMIVMAHKLGIRVIAEGIERAEQRDILRAMGCDYGQGYLFSQALNALEFERMLGAGEREESDRQRA